MAAAILAAGVVTASAFVGGPAQREIPTVSVDVVHTSAVTDALADAGQVVEVLNSLVGVHVDASISVPFEATLALLAAAEHPELSQSILSFLVHRFVNPATGDPIHAYPYDTELTVSRLAELLPYPLGPGPAGPGLINEGGVEFAALFNSVISQLGDPMPGYEAVQSVMNDTVVGGIVVAGLLATRAPMNMTWNAANYVGYLPANVEATFESALARPEQIPGLVSNLAHGLLSPDPSVGLLGKVVNNAVDPYTWLPAPVGYAPGAPGLANAVRDVIATVVNAMLSTLPAPVAPSALPPGTGPVLGPREGLSAAKGDQSVGVTTVPEESSTQRRAALASVPDVDEKPAAPEPVKKQIVKSEPVKTEPVDTKPVDTKPVKTEPVKKQPSKKELRKAERLKARTQTEATKTETTKTETTKKAPSTGDAD